MAFRDPLLSHLRQAWSGAGGFGAPCWRQREAAWFPRLAVIGPKTPGGVVARSTLKCGLLEGVKAWLHICLCDLGAGLHIFPWCVCKPGVVTGSTSEHREVCDAHIKCSEGSLEHHKGRGHVWDVKSMGLATDATR